MYLCKAIPADLPAILELQRAAFHSEAVAHNNFNIPPLTQGLSEITAEFESGVFLKAVIENGVIVGSVRGTVLEGTLYIGRLIVHPDWQGRGIGSRLLAELEALHPGLRYELFTSAQSPRNIQLYQRCGYRIFKQEQVGEITFVFLEKTENNCERESSSPQK